TARRTRIFAKRSPPIRRRTSAARARSTRGCSDGDAGATDDAGPRRGRTRRPGGVAAAPRAYRGVSRLAARGPAVRRAGVARLARGVSTSAHHADRLAVGACLCGALCALYRRLPRVPRRGGITRTQGERGRG